MRRITVVRNDGVQVEYAANEGGEGLFIFDRNAGSYRQLAGTAQTPKFKSAKQFRKYLGAGIGRMVSSFGWER
jgi:hypothetical protein